MDVSDAGYYIKLMKIKVAKWGTPTLFLKTKLGLWPPLTPSTRRTKNDKIIFLLLSSSLDPLQKYEEIRTSFTTTNA
jgi:hypothetical protein